MTTVLHEDKDGRVYAEMIDGSEVFLAPGHNCFGAFCLEYDETNKRISTTQPHPTEVTLTSADESTRFTCIDCGLSFFGSLTAAGDSLCNRCRAKERSAMSEFKTGDWVKCVDASGTGKLKEGALYPVADPDAVVIGGVGWSARRFVLAERRDVFEPHFENGDRLRYIGAPLGDRWHVPGTIYVVTDVDRTGAVRLAEEDSDFCREAYVVPFEYERVSATPAPAAGETTTTNTLGDVTNSVGATYTGEMTSTSPTGGVKNNAGKLQFSLILPEFEAAQAAVLTRGAEKYPDPQNWKKNPREWYVDALMRHTNALRRGEIMDDGPGGTGQPHTACISVNAMFIDWFDRTGGGSPNGK